MRQKERLSDSESESEREKAKQVFITIIGMIHNECPRSIVHMSIEYAIPKKKVPTPADILVTRLVNLTLPILDPLMVLTLKVTRKKVPTSTVNSVI